MAEQKKCKIRIIKEPYGLYPQYKPKVGKIYNAIYIDSSKAYKSFPPVCLIDMAGKRITLRQDEFEIVRVE